MTHDEQLLAQLLGKSSPSEADLLSEMEASGPDHEQRPVEDPDQRLAQLVERVHQAASKRRKSGPQSNSGPIVAPEDAGLDPNAFWPREPESLAEAELSESEVEALALKSLLGRGDLTGRQIAEQIALPFVLVDEQMRRLKAEQLVVLKSSAPMNDYVYQLTDLGRERARRYAAQCTYFGAAPVSLGAYVAAVAEQSLALQKPSPEDLERAFADLLINKRMLQRLGPAITAGRGLFLYGPPGNGKSSIAQRATRAFGEAIWIPRAIGVDGEIIRLFDPVNHTELPLGGPKGLWDNRKVDRRWVRIQRPTIIAGGELTMSSLEVTVNSTTGICEAPLQLKSNCGTLVIDDFGRQRIRVEELLNRWIVPLEERVDYLNLPNGKKICVPFDQLIIFSTNLEPRDLVDEAFLRRIPYKIEVVDPTEEEFHQLFQLFAPQLGIEYRKEVVDYLIERHYKSTGRPFRFCHPRDLLLQVANYCRYHDLQPELTEEYLDIAVDIYFSVM